MDDTNKIIEDNMGLVYKQLHKFHLINDEDALSLGMEALWHAIETFKTEKNFQFSTYASVCIYNALGMHVRHLNRKRKLEVISYNMIVDSYENDVELEYFLGDLTEDPEERLLSKELVTYINAVIQEEYNKLSGNAKIVIGIWLDKDYKIKQNEIANVAGITQTTVSRILSAFKYKLKKRLEEYQC